MKKKILSLLLVLTTFCSIVATGCSKNDDNSTEESTELNMEKLLKNLDEGSYYVIHNNKPKKLIFGNATFEYGDGSALSTLNENTERVMWFQEDWDDIPTFYEGDTLIYYSSDVLDEEFIFERFQDFGYTIGVCKMKQTPSGRYSISTDDKEMTLYPGSDAEEIGTFSQERVVLDTIGGKEVRESNVTRAGTFYGLKKDKSYKCELYAGTELNNMILKANVRALGSMQGYVSNDFDFLSSTIIKINIPDWFNSGYYCIDGVGMFRYVTGNKFTETMDMNVPNINPNELNYSADTVEDEKTLFIGTNELGKHKLTITITIPDTADGVFPKASCILTSPGDVYYSEEENENHQIVVLYDATDVGSYQFTLSDLNGRNYIYTDEIYSE